MEPSQANTTRRCRNLGASEGLSNTPIARRERVSLPTVGKWRSRYAKERSRRWLMHPAAELRKASAKKVEEILIRRWRERLGGRTGAAV